MGLAGQGALAHAVAEGSFGPSTWGADRIGSARRHFFVLCDTLSFIVARAEFIHEPGRAAVALIITFDHQPFDAACAWLRLAICVVA